MTQLCECLFKKKKKKRKRVHHLLTLQSLSPERLKKHPTSLSHQQQSGKHACPPGVTDEEVVFTEIWPSSEWHLSPTSTTTSDRLSPEVGLQQEPVLAKYVGLRTNLFRKVGISKTRQYWNTQSLESYFCLFVCLNHFLQPHQTFSLPGTSNAFAMVHHRVERSGSISIVPQKRNSIFSGGSQTLIYLTVQRPRRQQTRVFSYLTFAWWFLIWHIISCYWSHKLFFGRNSLVHCHYESRGHTAFEGWCWTCRGKGRWTVSALQQIPFPQSGIWYCECIRSNEE